MSFRGLLVHECDIERPTRSRSASGAISRSFATVATGVPCRYVERSERLFDPASGYRTELTIRLLVPKDVDIDTDYRVSRVRYPDGSSVKSKPDESGERTDATFLVDEVVRRVSTRVRFRSATLRRVS